MERWAVGWWTVGLMLVLGCSEFVAAEPEPVGETTSGSTSEAGATTSVASTQDSIGPVTPVTGPDSSTGPSTSPSTSPPTSQGSGMDSADAGSTSAASSSSTTDPDPSSTGIAELVCADLVRREAAAATCSFAGGLLVDLTILNDCLDVPIDVYWVDFSCEEVFYGRTEPGEAWVGQSYQGHPWRIRNAVTGALMREIQPLVEDTTLAVLER